MLLAREFTKDDELILKQMVDEIRLTDSNFEGLSNISNIENYDIFFRRVRKE